MPERSHTDYRELLYLETDGELTPAESNELERHVTGCAECRAERRQVERLQGLLADAVVPVDESLRIAVMKRLPEVGWGARHAGAWRLATAVFVILGLAATLLGLGGSGLAAEVPLVGAVVAMLDLFRSALLAGAGLLTASWKGIGLAAAELFQGSKIALAVLGLFVLGIDVLFLRLLLRRRKPAEAEGPQRESRSS
jgi:anti-sigma factor RsiW